MSEVIFHIIGLLNVRRIYDLGHNCIALKWPKLNPKLQSSFGHSECSRIKELLFFVFFVLFLWLSPSPPWILASRGKISLSACNVVKWFNSSATFQFG